MSAWLSATPEILLAVAILGVPGLVLALALRFRAWDAVGLSVPLSLGVLAVSDEVSTRGHVGWGLPVIAATTVILGVACLLVVQVVDRRRSAAQPVGTGVVDGSVWTARQHQIAAAATLGAAILGAIAVARGIGTPSSLNQTFDGVFHVNSIRAVAEQHLASPGLFAGLTNGIHSGGFYPPTFGAVAGLVAMYTGINAVNAANITALAMTIVWPFTVSIAVRRLARPTSFGYSIAMVGSVTVALFPALLLRFGTLWPNALSYLALAPALVVVVRLFGLDETEGADDPHGRIGWWPSLLVAVISIPGVVFAHPGAAYLIFYLAVPVLIWFGWRRLVVHSAGSVGAKALRATGTVAVVGLVFIVLVWASYRISAIAAVRHQFWPPTETWDESVGHVLLLGTRLNPPNAAMAILAIAGLYAAVRFARGRLLIAWYLIIATLSVLSAAIETPSTMRWTGFWYNDPFRLFAALPLVVLPLIALGSDELRDGLRAWVERLAASGAIRLPRLAPSLAVSSALVLCVGVLALQGGLGTRKVSNTVASSYANAPHVFVNAEQAAMFRRLHAKMSPGAAIAGDPYTGEVLAGVLSGQPVVYATLGRPSKGDRKLVALGFDRYQSDPAVCAAVKRLRIAVVVTGQHFFMETANRLRWFGGFENMAAIPGLTPIDSGGGATAYRVGPCRS